MLATKRGEKKLTRKVMMLQTIEAEHSFKVKQSEWLGVWAEHNHRTRRRRTGLSWLEYTVVTRDLSVCLSVTVTNGNASRDSLRRASPLSNCWLVANVGIPVCSGTTPAVAKYASPLLLLSNSLLWSSKWLLGYRWGPRSGLLNRTLGITSFHWTPFKKCCNFLVLKQFKGCHWRLTV